MPIPTSPITRVEKYLAAISGEGVDLPEYPITREESYLDAIQKNGGTSGEVTGVKGSAESTYRKGNVNLSAGNVGAYTKSEVDTLLDAKADQTDVEPLEPLSEKIDVQTIAGSDNLLQIQDADFSHDQCTISIRNNIVTINGKLNYSSGTGYLKVSNTPALAFESVPAEWLAERVSFLETGKQYGLQNFVLGGSVDVSGIVTSVKDSNDTTILSPSKGVVTLSNEGAYIRIYLNKSGQFTNYRFGIMITENRQATEWEGGGQAETIIAYKDFYKKYVKSLSWSNISFSHPTIVGQETQYIQGMCTDGSYLYAGIIDGTDSNNTYVAKISLSDGSIIASEQSFSLGHCNSMTYCEADGYIHCVALDNIGTVHRITTALAYVDSYTVDISNMYSAYTGIGALYYDPNREQFVGLIRGNTKGFVILDKDRNLSDIIWTQKVGGTYGALYADVDFIYLALYNPNKIAVFAWNGKLIDIYAIPGEIAETEQLTFNGDDIYLSYSILTGNNKGAYIAKGSVTLKKYGMLLKI